MIIKTVEALVDCSRIFVTGKTLRCDITGFDASLDVYLYDSKANALAALDWIARQFMDGKQVCIVPDDAEVEGRNHD